MPGHFLHHGVATDKNGNVKRTCATAPFEGTGHFHFNPIDNKATEQRSAKKTFSELMYERATTPSTAELLVTIPFNDDCISKDFSDYTTFF